MMTIKRIHVNQHHIKANAKGENLPVITVKDGSKNRYGNEVIIDGPSKVIYSPDKPLSCGARVFIETTSEVTIIGEMSYSEIKELKND